MCRYPLSPLELRPSPCYPPQEASQMSAFVSSPAGSERLADELVREIGEQVSLRLTKHLPKVGGTSLDLNSGIGMYLAHVGMFVPSLAMSIQSAAGEAPKEPGVYVIRHKQKVVYVGHSKDLQERIRDHARGASNSSKELDLYREHKDTTVTLILTGSFDAAKNLEANLIKKLEPEVNKREEKYHPTRAAKDASKRIVSNIVVGAASDVAVFCVGGAAWEIRDAYRNPGVMSILDRCKRFIVAIWENIKTSLKDRSLREIGPEVIVSLASVLAGMLKIATAAIEKIVSTIRRLWTEFIGGKIKSVSDLISICLKTLVALSTVAVATTLETKLNLYFSAVPGLAAVVAAAVAGVMIVLASRSIDGVIQGLLSIFNAGAIARRRREEIEKICEEALPKLIEDRERLQALADSYFAERESLLDATFKDIQLAGKNHDFDGFLKGLITINAAYGRQLPWASFEEFDEFMLDDDRTLKL